MAGIVAFITMQRMATAPKPVVVEAPKTRVLVAARDLPLRVVLEQADLATRDVPTELVLDDAITDPNEALGKLTTVDIAKGEMILRRRLLAPDYVGPRAAVVMSPTQVLIGMPATDLLINVGIVRPGDRVDLLYTYDFKASTPVSDSVKTLTVLQDLQVAAVIRAAAQASSGSGRPAEGAPQAVLFVVDPQDSAMIKYFQDRGADGSLELRSPDAKGVFDVVPVDGEYLIQRFKLRWRTPS